MMITDVWVQFCSDTFRYEYNNESIKRDINAFSTSRDFSESKGEYYMIFEGCIASAAFRFCPFCGKEIEHRNNE